MNKIFFLVGISTLILSNLTASDFDDEKLSSYSFYSLSIPTTPQEWQQYKKLISNTRTLNTQFGELMGNSGIPLGQQIQKECQERDKILAKEIHSAADLAAVEKARRETLPMCEAFQRVANTQTMDRPTIPRTIREKKIVIGIAQDESERMFDTFINRAKFPLVGGDYERHAYLKKLALKMVKANDQTTNLEANERYPLYRFHKAELAKTQADLKKDITSEIDLQNFKAALRDTTNIRTILLAAEIRRNSTVSQ